MRIRFSVIEVLCPPHYAVPDAPKINLFYESASFKQYMSINTRFAEIIIANYHEDNISQYPFLFSRPCSFRLAAWVDDHHLTLFPALLRADLKLINAPIGIRTASYAHRFRQTVGRILAWAALSKGIQVDHTFSSGIPSRRESLLVNTLFF